ncbi:type VI secretion system tube protein TssD [Flaviaesturariibacter amylovorans]|uniref:Type VI secretion system tube protein TssD n=1 Tax=Flaviaesturariibacter amylovorans TaxID=1084520 RepID=A0ABP8HRD1_9BACT
MSFKAKLKMGGKEFDVLHCSYTFRRDVDAKGRPASSVYGGTVQLEVESTDDTSVLESMINNVYKSQKGTITFQKRDEDAKMKELSFEDGYIVQYSEALDSVGSNPMTINFIVSARTLKIGNAEHQNDWPDKK